MVGDAATAACAHRIKSGMNIRRFMTNSSVLFLADERAVGHTIYHPRGRIVSEFGHQSDGWYGSKSVALSVGRSLRSTRITGPLRSASACLKRAKRDSASSL